MKAYATEVNDLRKNLAIQKTDGDRLRDENTAYKRQTQKLIEDIKALEGDEGVNIEQ
jgi:hypothetical protein